MLIALIFMFTYEIQYHLFMVFGVVMSTLKNLGCRWEKILGRLCPQTLTKEERGGRGCVEST